MNNARSTEGTLTAAPHGTTSLCRLAVMRNMDREILVCRNKDQFALPSIDLPANKRPAPILLSRLHATLGLNAICRYSFPVNPSGLCFVLDLLDPGQPLPGNLLWFAASDIRQYNLPSPLRELLREIPERTNVCAGRFVCPGWLGPVQTWVDAALAFRKLRLTGPVRQYNMGPDFALLRFATTGRAVWFKAVGHPNCHEFTITRQLSDLRLPHVPDLIAIDETLHAWLMYEAAGTFPGSCYSRDQWKWIARSLAELQVASFPHVPALRRAGACDLTALRLENGIETYLDQAARLMSRQPCEAPRRLTCDDLRLLGKFLRTACERVRNLAMPDSLGHSDFNAGNIMVHRGKAAFLDWALGHVGPPLLTFEYLRLLLARSCPADDVLMREIRDEYLSPWISLVSKRHLSEGLALAPLLAVFAYALVCHEASGDLKETGGETLGFLRSLARRAHREALLLSRQDQPRFPGFEGSPEPGGSRLTIAHERG